LYDLEKDPFELNNLILIPEYGTIRKELSEKLISHMLKAGENEPKILVASY
jgi:hypothetical protein